MDSTTIKNYHDVLVSMVTTDFKKKLLEASLNNLLDNSNKLRFNNFSCGIRELSRHVLSTLAPGNEVMKCSWYKNETKQVGKPSRGERIKYAIQGGLTDKFVKTMLDIEDFKIIVLDAIDLLNKYTHVNEDIFGIAEKDVTKLSGLVVNSFSDFVAAIRECKEALKNELEEHIDNALINHTMYESIDDIDILSTHHNIEEIETLDIHITDIKSEFINVQSSGLLNIRQQFGSDGDVSRGDGFEWNISFPFESTLAMAITKKFPKGEVSLEDFKVDTHEWYE